MNGGGGMYHILQFFLFFLFAKMSYNAFYFNTVFILYSTKVAQVPSEEIVFFSFLLSLKH